VVNGYPVFIGPETPRIELYTSDIDELENLSIEFQGKTIKKKIGYKDFRRLFCGRKTGRRRSLNSTSRKTYR
jgi:hypothetical protein